MADGDDGVAASGCRRFDAFEGRAGREGFARLAVAAERCRQGGPGLAGAQERARQDRIRLHAFRRKPPPEVARGGAAVRAQRPELVRLARRGVGVADQEEAHRGQNKAVPSYRYVVCDVFTETPLTGNQLAVFTDARGLATDQMQALAREVKFSESTFVLPAEQGGHARIRIFTPTAEVPFAGHPTLGTAFVLAAPMQLPEIRLETGNGIVPVRLEREEDRLVFGRMEQPLPSVRPFEQEAQLLAALGVARSELPVELYDNGIEHVYVALSTQDEVVALRPDLGALADLGGAVLGVNCFAGSGSNWKTRMFAPGGGVPEDPATGSAAGPLAFHLARHGLIEFGQEIEVTQGVEIDRPSKLFARVEGTADAAELVEVGGSTVVVARGEFRLP
jgi:trans-2,3-dihydro-3-hydroxyanthranilate isomerase